MRRLRLDHLLFFAECKFSIHPDIFDIEEAWAYDFTPQLKREIRQIIFQRYDITVSEWNAKFGAYIMPTTLPVTAERIGLEKTGLRLILMGHDVFIPWEHCSALLAHASDKERMNAELSPREYGIHWPLLDEDLSVGALLDEQMRFKKGR